MVKNPGTKVRTHRLRPLATPRRIEVQPDDRGLPRAVHYEGAMQEVAAVQDRWRIDDEWWRDTPVARLYCQVRLESGRMITLYNDLIGGAWWEQRY